MGLNPSRPIQIWNPKSKQLETEAVYGEEALELVYGTGIGRKIADLFLSRPGLSRVYGAYQSSRLSAHKIQPFIRDFSIPMEEYEPGPYRTFNEFFIRKFKTGAREFASDPSVLPAFAEGRYLGFERITNENLFPVKGENLSAAAILGSASEAGRFLGGPVLIARLCPTDYHRFHFPDSGSFVLAYRIPGRFHSVNPRALESRSGIFSTNERFVSLLRTKNFGLIAYIEIGALCVGKIVQTHSTEGAFSRGEEKGYFLFGASTVIVMGEPGVWRPQTEILEQTTRSFETLVRLGEPVARATRRSS